MTVIRYQCIRLLYVNLTLRSAIAQVKLQEVSDPHKERVHYRDPRVLSSDFWAIRVSFDDKDPDCLREKSQVPPLLLESMLAYSTIFNRNKMEHCYFTTIRETTCT
ncbi:uncharacterized protein LOC143152842 isoform X2 [Ptiloglossa arizonensis]|uniref:uncharacterized protein LOC143152842 isoform X2 n=1 Tax=Ptiloglossa arizonensis TaxID=3350558 RepID=UPI003FA16EF4